jgi:3-oxoacyl-[acyl-carrier-protein] synthase II
MIDIRMSFIDSQAGVALYLASLGLLDEETIMHRVVVTGMGTITPVGHTLSETWQSVVEGRSGAGPITLFDTTGYDIHTAAEVKDFNPAATLGVKTARRQDRFEQLANVAASEAITNSGLEITDENSIRIGQAISCAFGGIMSMVEQITLLNAEGPHRVDPLGLTRFMTTSPSVSIAHGLRGPSFSAASACATGADGIGLAYHMLRAGIVDAMVAGGVDAPLCTLAIATFNQMRAYSQRNDATPRPFSADRDGLILGEGAGVLVLETLDHASARGAAILAEVAGYGATSDAYHIAAPLAEGTGSAAAISVALNDAKLNPEDVDYISAHGTGTTINDSAETFALKRALGEHAYNIPISSTKSMTGHMMGAAGAVEAAFCIQAICTGTIPPTINYTTPDPQCDLDYVPNTARNAHIDVAMSNAFGFGGHNSVLIFKHFVG